MLRYFIGFIATIALIILVIILIFGGGGKSKVPKTNQTLDSYAGSNSEVDMIIDGPINADQNHNQIKISVTNNTATFEQVQGYQGSVVKQQVYTNNISAYTNFLFALERAGYTLGDTNLALKDERGYCPLGDRYIFELKQDNLELERYWATSCGSTKTYKGALGLTETLFQNQIPDYDTLSSNVNL